MVLKNLLKSAVLLIMIAMLPTVSNAQFEIGAQLRPRAEFRNGFKTLRPDGHEPAFFTEQRSRLNLNFTTDNYKVGFKLQDIRIWGATNQLNKSDGFTSIHEAWGAFKFSEQHWVKIGRQEIILDDSRIMGNVGWAAQARSHDAIVLQLNDSTWNFHFGVAFNQDNTPDEPTKLNSTFYNPAIKNYKTMQYAWFHKDFNATNLSFLLLNNGVQLADSSVNFTQTMGLTGKSKLSDNLKLLYTFYYQTGKDKGNLDVSAYMASVALNINKKFTVGGDFMSGTERDSDSNGSFDPLYGTHHKFYGLMDYFYVGNGHGQSTGTNNNNVGLTDVYLKFATPFSEKTKFNIALHQFLSPVQLYDRNNTTETVGSNLGTEIDLVMNHSITKDVKLSAGYSQLFATKGMESIKTGNSDKFTNWAWIMIDFTPTFFKK